MRKNDVIHKTRISGTLHLHIASSSDKDRACTAPYNSCKKIVKFGRVVLVIEICERTDRQVADRQTYRHDHRNTSPLPPIGGEVTTRAHQ